MTEVTSILRYLGELLLYCGILLSVICQEANMHALPVRNTTPRKTTVAGAVMPLILLCI